MPVLSESLLMMMMVMACLRELYNIVAVLIMGHFCHDFRGCSLPCLALSSTADATARGGERTQQLLKPSSSGGFAVDFYTAYSRLRRVSECIVRTLSSGYK